LEVALEVLVGEVVAEPVPELPTAWIAE